MEANNQPLQIARKNETIANKRAKQIAEENKLLRIKLSTCNRIICEQIDAVSSGEKLITKWYKSSIKRDDEQQSDNSLIISLLVVMLIGSMLSVIIINSLVR